MSLPLVLSLGAGLRLALSLLTSISPILQDRPELSVPLTSLSTLREAIYRRQLHSTSRAHPGVYAGDVTAPPLVVELLAPFLSVGRASTKFSGAVNGVGELQTNREEWVESALWAGLDVLTALLIARCATRSGKRDSVVPHVAAALYLFSPYTIASCLARSTSPLNNLLVVLSTYGALLGSRIILLPALASATLVSLYPILLTPALLLLCAQSAKRGNTTSGLRLRLTCMSPQRYELRSSTRSSRCGGFLGRPVVWLKCHKSLFLLSLLYAVYFTACNHQTGLPCSLGEGNAGHVCRRQWMHTSSTAGYIIFSIFDLNALLALGVSASWLAAGRDWAFLNRVYGTIILARDLTPNIGLWWYFFIEIFEHFRNFFLLAFNVHAASYALPMTFKYQQDPLFAVTALCGVISVFKSYPTMGDVALFLGLLGLHTDLFSYLRYPLVSALLFAYATLLLPIFHYMWLRAGSGNANFYYAITLVWGLAVGALVLDVMWAWGRARWEEERPKLPLPSEEVVVERILAPPPPPPGGSRAATPVEKEQRFARTVRDVVQE